MTTSHHAMLILFFTVLGSCLGSFLNVCAYRIPRGMSVLRPRSRCPRCGASILARDNIPVLGWLLLRGRCRECQRAIPPGYPVVELVVGMLFALPYLCAAAIAAGDPWERIGAGPMLGILLMSWTVTGLGVFLFMVGGERRRRPLMGPSASKRDGDRGPVQAPAPSVSARGEPDRRLSAVQPPFVAADPSGASTVFRGSTSAHRTMPISAATTKP